MPLAAHWGFSFLPLKSAAHNASGYVLTYPILLVIKPPRVDLVSDGDTVD